MGGASAAVLRPPATSEILLAILGGRQRAARRVERAASRRRHDNARDESCVVSRSSIVARALWERPRVPTTQVKRSEGWGTDQPSRSLSRRELKGPGPEERESNDRLHDSVARTPHLIVHHTADERHQEGLSTLGRASGPSTTKPIEDRHGVQGGIAGLRKPAVGIAQGQLIRLPWMALCCSRFNGVTTSSESSSKWLVVGSLPIPVSRRGGDSRVVRT